MFTAKSKKILLFIHCSIFYIISTLMMYYYLGEPLYRWYLKTLLFFIGLIVSHLGFEKKENLLSQNILGGLFFAVFIIQSIIIWEGFYLIKDIFAISFVWGLVIISFNLNSRRLFNDLYIVSFILMIYNASIAFNLFYLIFLLLYFVTTLSFFILLVPELKERYNAGISFGKISLKSVRSSILSGSLIFIAAILIYSVTPYFWNVTFFNLPITRNRNFFLNPDIEEKTVGLSGFSLEFSLTSGKVWNDPTPVIELKTADLSQLIYLKGVVYDSFDGRNWENTMQERERLNIVSWQFNMPFQKSPNINYESHVYFIRYLLNIPNVLFYENHPIVLRFPARSIELDDNGNVFIPRIDNFPFKYSIVIEKPIGLIPVENKLPQYQKVMMSRYLEIDQISQRTVDLVNSIVKGLDDDHKKATSILNYLGLNYKYDLEFSILPGTKDLIDYFLFDHKKGYCEQFATVYAIMLRIAGIPSRVIGGFAGGDYDRGLNAILFRGSHAHAWVEAYFDKYGWITLDPTPVSSYEINVRRNKWLDLFTGIFGRDPQNLIPIRARKVLKGVLVALGDLVSKNIPFILLAMLLISAYIMRSRILKVLRLFRKPEGGVKRYFNEIEKEIAINLNVKREKWQTEKEFISKIENRIPFLRADIHSFLNIYLRCRYGYFEDSDIIQMNIGLKNIKIMLKKNKKDIII